MSPKKNLTPTTDRNDPWNRNFTDFKNYHETNNHRTQNGRVPESSVFDLGEIINKMQSTSATKIAIIAMKHPNPVDPHKDQGLMVAVFCNDNLQRLEDKYLAAEHNCPDDCRTDPVGRPKYEPKPSKGAKKATKQAAKKVSKKAVKKAAIKR